MSPRTRPTFAKRQKEHARQEKQRAKAERKLQKKLNRQSLGERAESDESQRAESDETFPPTATSTAP